MTPSGSGSETGPLTKSTVQPAAFAAFAKAKPILPVEGLLTKRTGSKNSRVGPAVIKQRSGIALNNLEDGGTEGESEGDPFEVFSTFPFHKFIPTLGYGSVFSHWKCP